MAFLNFANFGKFSQASGGSPAMKAYNANLMQSKNVNPWVNMRGPQSNSLFLANRMHRMMGLGPNGLPDMNIINKVQQNQMFAPQGLFGTMKAYDQMAGYMRPQQPMNQPAPQAAGLASLQKGYNNAGQVVYTDAQGRLVNPNRYPGAAPQPM